jgi:hypothetical protein
MIKPEIIKGIKPLFFNKNILLYSIGNYVYECKWPLIEKNSLVAYYYKNIINHFLAKNHFISKVLRYGYKSVKPYKNGLIGIQKNNIIYKSENQKKFQRVFSKFNGSRPLNLLICPNQKIYFGEYFSNNENKEVRIFCSDNGTDWNTVYKFNPGEIRHIHSLQYDEYRKGIWVMTGDSNSESGIWFTSDDFKSLKKVVDQGQRGRAVNIIILQDSIIIPMDSPDEKNYILEYNFKNNQINELCSVENSVFHICKIDQIYLMSTVPEPSYVNDIDNVYIYASLDCRNWQVISVFKKDIIPGYLQKYTRYPEVEFCEGTNSSKYIIGYGRSIKNYSNCMILWNKNDIKEILNDSK